jgi:hypothetical protein
MKVKRKSPLTGKSHEMDLPITAEQIGNYNRGAMIQDAFPHLTPSQREFILTGISPEEWDATFPEEDE